MRLVEVAANPRQNVGQAEGGGSDGYSSAVECGAADSADAELQALVGDPYLDAGGLEGLLDLLAVHVCFRVALSMCVL